MKVLVAMDSVGVLSSVRAGDAVSSAWPVGTARVLAVGEAGGGFVEAYADLSGLVTQTWAADEVVVSAGHGPAVSVLGASQFGASRVRGRPAGRRRAGRRAGHPVRGVLRSARGGAARPAGPGPDEADRGRSRRNLHPRRGCRSARRPRREGRPPAGPRSPRARWPVPDRSESGADPAARDRPGGRGACGGSEPAVARAARHHLASWPRRQRGPGRPAAHRCDAGVLRAAGLARPGVRARRRGRGRARVRDPRPGWGADLRPCPGSGLPGGTGRCARG